MMPPPPKRVQSGFYVHQNNFPQAPALLGYPNNMGHAMMNNGQGMLPQSAPFQNVYPPTQGYVRPDFIQLN
jgi:hypothetical protein